MKAERIESKFGIETLVFNGAKTERLFVYLHGSGEFGKGVEGQFEYPGFATLLSDGVLEIPHPFAIACCVIGENWEKEMLSNYLKKLSARFDNPKIDLLGYSRGGEGAYRIADSPHVNSVTVINSRLPKPYCTDTPLHVIHAVDDQITPIDSVRAFSRHVESVSKLTEWQGDHYCIEPIARSKVWFNWIMEST
ncbi:MAG: hypothetical protein JKY88_05480 [Pseudomonadales bacterium]|nr:hypothetical protein [Pseudomonadales bacterium]